jgi:hypothetical protein
VHVHEAMSLQEAVGLVLAAGGFDKAAVQSSALLFNKRLLAVATEGDTSLRQLGITRSTASAGVVLQLGRASGANAAWGTV